MTFSFLQELDIYPLLFSNRSSQEFDANNSIFALMGSVGSGYVLDASEWKRLFFIIIIIFDNQFAGFIFCELFSSWFFTSFKTQYGCAVPFSVFVEDIFPCKACGIWFRSERNLQAHLMYYCSGRLRDPEMVAEKNANISHQMLRGCTYPQCNMSFVSSNALEMHLSTHHSE